MVGAIDFGPSLGGWDIKNIPVTSLPEDVATALGGINELGVLGATFEPIWYVGSQIVNGVNHKIICRETRTTRYHEQVIVAVTINIPAGSIGGEGATIVSIEEEADLTPEEKVVFEAATAKLVGIDYTPVVFIGTQIVKGKNYYFICQAKQPYPGAVPYAVTMTVNVFGCCATVTQVSPIAEPEKSCGLGAPLGEWP